MATHLDITMQSDKISILIYGMNYTPEIAGVGFYTGQMGAFLAASGDYVTVVTSPPHYPGWRILNGKQNWWSFEVVDGTDVYRCPIYLATQMRGWRRALSPLTFALSSAIVFTWKALSKRTDVIFVIEPTILVAPIALLVAWITGAKTILHVQDLEIDAAFAVGHLPKSNSLSAMASRIDGLIKRRFTHIVTISNAMAEIIEEKGVNKQNIKVIRNWVDLNQIQPIEDSSSYRKILNLKDTDYAVLYSGNLGAKQGIGTLLEAARLLKDQPLIKFIIAGEGPMKAEIAKIASISPNIYLRDFEPLATFSQFLGAADLHILPQQRGVANLLLPSKLGGMLASGKPILVTAEEHTELSNFLGDSCWFCPPEDGPMLAKAIEAASKSPFSPSSRTQRLQLAKKLSKESAIQQFTALLHDHAHKVSD